MAASHSAIAAHLPKLKVGPAMRRSSVDASGFGFPSDVRGILGEG